MRRRTLARSLAALAVIVVIVIGAGAYLSDKIFLRFGHQAVLPADFERRFEPSVLRRDVKHAVAMIRHLRGTPGGSLAARTLLNNLALSEADLGWFVSQAWWRQHTQAPTRDHVDSLLRDDLHDPAAAFGRPMVTGCLKVGVRPGPRSYQGPVFVLIDRKTASVAELAAASLKGARRATLIGETTAGELLTADTLPLVEGFSVLMPLADYFDANLGRIEGVGVSPDVRIDGDDALDIGRMLARRVSG